MTESAAAGPSSERRRLVTLLSTLVVLSGCVGIYLFGPMLPGTLGRLQAATWEAWGWAGPARVSLTAEPAAAWITLEGPALPSRLEGRGSVQAKLSPGVYHCTVQLRGYTTQSFELVCGPDARVARRVTLEPAR